MLVQECYSCHGGSGKAKGGLRLDHRAGLLKGGDSGPALLPGRPAESLLLKSIRHLDPDLKMPRNGTKLDDETLRDFELWIKQGAADPRDNPATPEEIARDSSFPAVLKRRRRWWSFQPLADPVPPPGTGNPVDRFQQARLEAEGLSPSPEADARVLARRFHLVLIGLPPSPEEVEAFAAAHARDPQAAAETITDRLLASPRFGERWARHWMDVMRYAETHGSEGDPAIPHAWRYRDYLIRALNADVPYAQLVREHLAGDLLERPRINPGLGINESALGTAQLRMVLHGFSPTDSLDERVTFTENQIDTVTKAFLGLTVTCARCHDHKFDPISQADFTAFYGIFTSTRPAIIDVNTPERQQLHRERIGTLKTTLRQDLAKTWPGALEAALAQLRAWTPDPKKLPADGPLAAWARLARKAPADWPKEWARFQEQDEELLRKETAFRAQPSTFTWDARTDGLKNWTADGPGLSGGAAPAGSFSLHVKGPLAISGIHPAGLYSNLISEKHRGLLSSPCFTAEGGKLWVRARGSKARVRYVVQNYPRSGTVHHRADVNSDVDIWVSWPLDYWKGDSLHLEVCTQPDTPIEGSDAGNSWFGLREVFYAREGGLAPPSGRPALALLDASRAPADPDTLAERYATALRRCIERWAAGGLSDAEAEFLDAFVRPGWLPHASGPLVGEFRRLEAEIPAPTRAPGVIEGGDSDQPLFVRGDHKQPAARVPRRFLEALDPTPYTLESGRSGRKELAESFVSASNPLLPRVIVNRLWQHLFGRGLIATPDNFGRLGERPTHPELLEWLARRFVADQGSLKAMIRLLATSRTFRLEDRATPEARARDPQNLLLSHFSARRLEAEAIRDAMLSLTGKLDLSAGGPPVDGGAYRRSVYLRVVRNNLDPFLATFDSPVPSSCRGRRDSTNVPAQSLGLMNDPLVSRWAADWARRFAKGDPDAAVGRMFLEAYGRLPTPAERELAKAHVAEADLKSLALALLNTKEFIYVR